MPEFLQPYFDTAPWAALCAFMFAVVAVRSTLVFWLGRWGMLLVGRGEEPASGLRRTAWRWANAPATHAAMETIRRKGWAVISVSYLTVGIQSVIILAAGVVGMTWPRFALAAVPGWVAWALIYSTIGFAMWNAAVAAAAGSPTGIAVITLLVSAIGGYIYYKRTQEKEQNRG